MHQISIALHRADRSIIPGLTLGGLWFAGVSLGLLAERFYGGPVRAMALTAGAAELTFRDSCVVTVLPLFLSAFAVFFFHRSGAYLACGVRGVCEGFALGCLMAAGGAWLALLLRFSGLCCSVCTLWFLERRLHMGMTRFRGDCVRCLIAALGISAVDTWVVAPFLARALSF